MQDRAESHELPNLLEELIAQRELIMKSQRSIIEDLEAAERLSKRDVRIKLWVRPVIAHLKHLLAEDGEDLRAVEQMIDDKQQRLF